MDISKEIKRPLLRFFGAGVFVFCLFLPACGSETPATTGGPVILIENGMIIATPDIQATSGATISILNHDSTPHTITSESAAGAFDTSGVFDVTVAAGSAGIFVLPVAAAGTIYHYYCRFHESSMAPVDGTITIE